LRLKVLLLLQDVDHQWMDAKPDVAVELLYSAAAQ
jgi:hypothetical protein